MNLCFLVFVFKKIQTTYLFTFAASVGERKFERILVNGVQVDGLE